MHRETFRKSQNFDIIEWKLRLSDPWYRLVMKMLTQVMPNFGGKRILEVGCGIGGFCINVADEGASVIGVDVAPRAIAKAKSLAKKLGVLRNTEFIMEIVICSETLEHVSYYKKAFSELVRVTKISGYLCLTVPNLFSSLFFEYIILRLLGQPKYVKRQLCIEKEDIFHIFKLRQLFYCDDLKIIKIGSTNFFHIPPRLKNTLKLCQYFQNLSDRIEEYFEAHNLPFRFLGANLGVLARKN
jgi:SAM-dependent methyltransferase